MSPTPFIPLMIPDIQQQDIDAVSDVLRSGMLIQGKKVAELEQQIADYINIDHVIAVSNGTATMHLALLAAGIGIGDEVIVPAFSYAATANVVELVGATSIFVDIQLNNFNIDIDAIEQAITSRTKAIIPVHEFGLGADMPAICSIAKKYSLFVLEDAACALGATVNNQFVGTFGDVGSFSLHPRKAITSGEGGLIVTNNATLAQKLRILRNHGIDTSNGTMDFVEAGYNYRLTDFQAALVGSQFNRLPTILETKNKLASIYATQLQYVNALMLPSAPPNKKHTWQSYHVVLDKKINRENMILHLKENGIGVNYGAQCIPALTYYTNKYKINAPEHFPNAWIAFTQGLVLPLYEKLSVEEIQHIAKTFITLMETEQNAIASV